MQALCLCQKDALTFIGKGSFPKIKSHTMSGSLYPGENIGDAASSKPDAGPSKTCTIAKHAQSAFLYLYADRCASMRCFKMLLNQGHVDKGDV